MPSFAVLFFFSWAYHWRRLRSSSGDVDVFVLFMHLDFFKVCHLWRKVWDWIASLES
jgi:hypothetical protein